MMRLIVGQRSNRPDFAFHFKGDARMLTKKCLNGLWDFSCNTDSLETLPTEWDTVSIKVPSPFNVNSFSHGYGKKTAGEEYYVSGADFRLYP